MPIWSRRSQSWSWPHKAVVSLSLWELVLRPKFLSRLKCLDSSWCNGLHLISQSRTTYGCKRKSSEWKKIPNAQKTQLQHYCQLWLHLFRMQTGQTLPTHTHASMIDNWKKYTGWHKKWVKKVSCKILQLHRCDGTVNKKCYLMFFKYCWVFTVKEYWKMERMWQNSN